MTENLVVKNLINNSVVRIMNKIFIVNYAFDDGTNYYNDSAIIIAESESEARIKITNAINKIDSETVLTEIFHVKEFTKDIFTRSGYWETNGFRRKFGD